MDHTDETVVGDAGEMMTVDEYLARYGDPAAIEVCEHRNAARLAGTKHMTMREFIAGHAANLLDDFDADDGAYARCGEWLDDKEAALGLAPTFREDGTTVYHPALLAYCLHMIASGAL